MAETSSNRETPKSPTKRPHAQQLGRSSFKKAAVSGVLHSPIVDDFLAPPTSANVSLALEPIQLPKNDHAIFSNLKKLSARCCVAKFEKTPKEAAVCFKYLNQGGANVIFKIHPWLPNKAGNGEAFIFVDAKIDTSKVIPIHHSELVNKVLRVDKGLSKTLRCDEIISGFYSHVWPLFAPAAPINIVVISPEATYVLLKTAMPNLDYTRHLMDHQGVALYPSVMVDITSKAEAVREEREAQRPWHMERWGILLPDMSPTVGSSVTVEVKPKWLAQSPTAPPNAIRCRTCALQVIKPKDPKKYICPLQLLNGSWDLVYPWILGRVKEQIDEHSTTVKPNYKDQTSAIASHLATYLIKGDGQALLWHLRSLQRKLDHHGVLCRKWMKDSSQDVRAAFDRNLRLAMTLRDCSLFIRIKYSSSGADASSIECKLGDLDFKSADKMDDWLEKESELLKSNAYTRELNEDLGCLIPHL
jgi:inositol-pentakisphosphate 2-kinase